MIAVQWWLCAHWLSRFLPVQNTRIEIEKSGKTELNVLLHLLICPSGKLSISSPIIQMTRGINYFPPSGRSFPIPLFPIPSPITITRQLLWSRHGFNDGNYIIVSPRRNRWTGDKKFQEIPEIVAIKFSIFIIWNRHNMNWSRQITANRHIIAYTFIQFNKPIVTR